MKNGYGEFLPTTKHKRKRKRSLKMNEPSKGEGGLW